MRSSAQKARAAWLRSVSAAAAATRALRALPVKTIFAWAGGEAPPLPCPCRVAVDPPGPRFPLPEVMPGTLPGWGGAKRLPRPVGRAAALDILLPGRAVDARRA